MRVLDASAGSVAAAEVVAALRAQGHDVRTDDEGHAAVAVLGALPAQGAPPDAQEVWLLGDVLGTAADLAGGGPVDLPDVVTAVLCTDATQQGQLDSRGPEVAARTRAVWGDLDARLRRLLERAFPSGDGAGSGAADRPLRVVVAGHDLNFFRAILDHLERRTDVEVRVDPQRTFANHDEARSRELLEWADTAFCEWLSPIAAWYSHHKPADVRLVVRLHRMELYNDWPDAVDIDAIDQVVCVSPHYVRLTLDRTSWPVEKITCIPNYVDCDVFDRPKLPGAVHHLGFVGIVPSRKRFDLALDVVERLRERDRRYQLFVKTKMPWEYPWNWREESERHVTAVLMDRLASSPSLREGVVLDPHGADVAAWLRRVGHVLSVSDDESFHLAPAEGMASGAVPVVRDWPGSDTIYDPRWIHGSVEAMVDAVDDVVRDGSWPHLRAQAQQQVRASFDVSAVCARFVSVLRGEAQPPVPATMSVPLADVRVAGASAAAG